jgi:short-subunit dehydrogenase
MSKKCQLENGIACIVTGASSGIGKALALALAERYKAQLVITARNQEKLAETQKLIEKAGGKAVSIIGDMGDSELPKQLADACMKNFGKINMLVNNAGFGIPGLVTDLTPKDWERVFAVNFFGPLYATYAILPEFQKQGRGVIVNISSVAGKVPVPGSVCYAASKFALTGMSESMASEFASKNIDILTICPGWVRTEFFANNKMMDAKNPTLIAEKNDFRGWLMRHQLSISSEEAAEEIIKALQKGGSAEIVLTKPGVFIERLHGLFPDFTFKLMTKIPNKYVDSSNKVSSETN